MCEVVIGTYSSLTRLCGGGLASGTAFAGANQNNSFSQQLARSLHQIAVFSLARPLVKKRKKRSSSKAAATTVLLKMNVLRDNE
ncbi:MAG: hypothetical protein AAF915_15425 [Cyanobacteria bacterium P01_D01_bin.50]